mmetsp:Transcript_13599/g.31982  ORF Transcript_13599/g.31982 Transcript_13599/m.31982 type:complete len:346 (+) Transcript_13599:1500-2537(+)
MRERLIRIGPPRRLPKRRMQGAVMHGLPRRRRLQEGQCVPARAKLDVGGATEQAGAVGRGVGGVSCRVCARARRRAAYKPRVCRLSTGNLLYHRRDVRGGGAGDGGEASGGGGEGMQAMPSHGHLQGRNRGPAKRGVLAGCGSVENRCDRGEGGCDWPGGALPVLAQSMFRQRGLRRRAARAGVWAVRVRLGQGQGRRRLRQLRSIRHQLRSHAHACCGCGRAPRALVAGSLAALLPARRALARHAPSEPRAGAEEAGLRLAHVELCGGVVGPPGAALHPVALPRLHQGLRQLLASRYHLQQQLPGPVASRLAAALGAHGHPAVQLLRSPCAELHDELARVHGDA